MLRVSRQGTQGPAAVAVGCVEPYPLPVGSDGEPEPVPAWFAKIAPPAVGVLDGGPEQCRSSFPYLASMLADLAPRAVGAGAVGGHQGGPVAERGESVVVVAGQGTAGSGSGSMRFDEFGE